MCIGDGVAILVNWQTSKTANNKIKFNTDSVIAEAMKNIDADYEALCSEYALATV